jgi:hypothetical protein
MTKTGQLKVENSGQITFRQGILKGEVSLYH